MCLTPRTSVLQMPAQQNLALRSISVVNVLRFLQAHSAASVCVSLETETGG